MPDSLFIDIHILQSVPPSNINRDDTGSPKTARFGGAVRSRVSSQAWKKATRDLFPQYLQVDEIGERTKHAVDTIAQYIESKQPDFADKAEEAAESVLSATGIKVKAKETGYLFFIAPKQAEKLADLAVEALRDDKPVDKKAAKAILDTSKNPTLNAVDIAMFGRMVADAPDLNVDAAVQVAHAISVGRAQTEFDYFTALDDRAPENNAGAAMIETTEFTSSTLYRYADIDVFHLCENLGSAKAACRGIEAFLRSFALSMPTGKQNSFANRTLPAAVVVQLRQTQPVSLVNAFEKPVVATNDRSQTAVACERLVEQEDVLDKAFGVKPLQTFAVVGSSEAVSVEGLSGAQLVDLDTLISEVSSVCADYLAGRSCPSEGDE